MGVGWGGYAGEAVGLTTVEGGREEKNIVSFLNLKLI